MKKIFLLIAIAIIIAGGAYYLYLPPSGFNQDLTIMIDGGSSTKQIARELKSRGAIRSISFFNFVAGLSKAEKKLIAGEHQLKAKSNIQEILRQLQSKSNLNRERNITIIEGWRLKEIRDYLLSEGVVSQADFDEAAAIANWRNKYDFLQDGKIKTLEGFLFPDTYRIFTDASAKDIITKMLDNFDWKLTTAMKDELAAQKRSLYEVVILASIIEREALYDEDRFVISSIFLNRLKEGIGLQSDATINYITGKKTARPSYADLQADSPYNTYKYRGLPPGPISNPGFSSLKAAIYPQATDYFYFLTDSDGRAHFAKTYAGHQENISKYLE